MTGLTHSHDPQDAHDHDADDDHDRDADDEGEEDGHEHLHGHDDDAPDAHEHHAHDDDAPNAHERGAHAHGAHEHRAHEHGAHEHGAHEHGAHEHGAHAGHAAQHAQSSVSAMLFEHRDEIVHEWEREVARVGQKRGGAADVAALVEYIARVVEPGQIDRRTTDDGVAASRPDMWNHVVTRLADGLDLGAVVAELSVLRECIVRIWHRERRCDAERGCFLDEIIALHRAVDAAIDSAIEQGLDVQHAVQDAADRAFAKLDALLAASPVGIAFVDAQLRYQRINESLAAINGKSVDAHLGRRVRDVLPGDAAIIEPALEHVLENGEAMLNMELSTAPPSSRERVRDFLVNIFPVRTATGELLGAGIVVAEVSDVNEAKQRAERAAAELEAVIENMPAAVFIGTKGRVSRANRLARTMLGDDVLGAGHSDLTAITQRVRAREPTTGEVVAAEDMPYARALRGERVVKDTIVYDAGAEADRWVTTYSAPVPPPQQQQPGEPSAVSVVVDVTERRRAEESARFLAEATALLSSSFDERDMLSRLASLVVPRLADWCAVDVGVDGRKERVAVAPRHRDEPGRALYSDRFTVALRARERVLGTMTFVHAESGRRFDAVDTALLSDLAERASTAVDNAHLYGEVRRAVRTREEVLAIVSHDLKSPLSAVSLAASLLQKRVDDNARPQVETILRAGRRMERLINDLLDMASVQAGRLAVVKAPEEMPSIVREAAEEQRAAAQARRVTINVEIDPHLNDVRVLCDRRRVLQLLGNLIGNAVKFSPPESGVVGVAARTRKRDGADVVELSVIDRGPGIAKELMPRLFEPFWSAPEHAEKGTGLGLTIAKGIVDSHGGTIAVESTPGDGATFVVTLPMRDG